MPRRRVTEEIIRQVRADAKAHPERPLRELGEPHDISEASVRKILGRGVYGPGGARAGKKMRPPSTVDLRELVEGLEARATNLLSNIQELKKSVEVLDALDKTLADTASLSSEVARTKQEVDRVRAMMVERAMAIHSDPRD